MIKYNSSQKVKKVPLLDKTLDELSVVLLELGEPKFRAKQLYDWLIKGASFDEMLNISAILKQKLFASFSDTSLEIEKVFTADDKSEKYLYRLLDGQLIEGVLLPNKYGNTLCISTQVGCRMGCKFCTSGENGLERNLSPAEIAGQFIAVCRYQDKKSESLQGKKNTIANGAQVPSRPISNIVFMGSGEPLDNYDNVIAAVKLLTNPLGLNISVRNISLSTCGLVPEILRLAEENLGLTLSLSLHATTDITRQFLMPIAKRYSIATTIDALKVYFRQTGRRVCIEYVLVAGKNDALDDAKRLANLTTGYSCHVNLINLNSARDKNLKSSKAQAANDFLKTLTALNVSASLRRSYGADVFGACGQLRGAQLK